MASLNAIMGLLERAKGTTVSLLGNLFGTPKRVTLRTGNRNGNRIHTTIWERTLRRSGRALMQPRPSWPHALAGSALGADFVEPYPMEQRWDMPNYPAAVTGPR